MGVNFDLPCFWMLYVGDAGTLMQLGNEFTSDKLVKFYKFDQWTLLYEWRPLGTPFVY